MKKRAGGAAQQHCTLQSEKELHHSNVVNYKTSRNFTTATLIITKRTAVAPQQHCKLQDEQEFYHSNIANDKTPGAYYNQLVKFKTSRRFTPKQRGLKSASPRKPHARKAGLRLNGPAQKSIHVSS